MIYFISDTHFNHKNIIKYCNRPFDSVEQMNEIIIRNWNQTVSQNDVVFHLGDFALGKKDDALNIIKNLNGEKYLLRGNHDKIKSYLYESYGFHLLKNPPIKLDYYKLILSHIPIEDSKIPDGYINLHGHIHDKNLYDCFDKYARSKYSLEKHINLSCDVTNFKPVSLDQILKLN